MRLRTAIVAAALTLLAFSARAQPLPPGCPPVQSTPQFSAGGNVFGRLATQWNQYFGAKVDAVGGILCNAVIINAQIIGPTSLTAGQVITALGYQPLNPTMNLSDLTNPALARAALGIGSGTWTTGSVIFANSSTTLGQDNANLFWNDSTLQLGIRTTSLTTGRNITSQVGSTAGINVGLSVRGYQPSVEFFNQAGSANWYIGINDADANKFYLGRGYGPNQGVPPDIVIDQTDNIGIGLPSPAARLHVTTNAAANSLIVENSLSSLTGVDIARIDTASLDNLNYKLFRVFNSSGEAFSVRGDRLTTVNGALSHLGPSIIANLNNGSGNTGTPPALGTINNSPYSFTVTEAFTPGTSIFYVPYTVEDHVTSGFNGFRTTVAFNQFVDVGNGKVYQADFAYGTMSGGTGSIFGGNQRADLLGCSVAASCSLGGDEIDVLAAVPLFQKLGLSIVSWATDANHGSNLDAGLYISIQTGGVGFNNVIYVNPLAVASGGHSLFLPNFTLDASGNLVSNGQGSFGTNVLADGGAGFAEMSASVTGSHQGTVKIFNHLRGGTLTIGDDSNSSDANVGFALGSGDSMEIYGGPLGIGKIASASYSLDTAAGINTTGLFVNAATPTAGAGQIAFGNSTVGPGTANCPTLTSPANAGCRVINIAGTARYEPFY